ncbi:MAG: phospho-sugar mutase, partial [Eggerthellaceae bacterium]|nr:phospho-sugar mutase [Eggerthellaceae bacterium]
MSATDKQMISSEIRKRYDRWCRFAHRYADELAAMDEETLVDAFYTDLEFGTAGLRGIMGPGTNRMNDYTVARASQGLANHTVLTGGKSIAVSFDSRHHSAEFARLSASVFAAAGLHVYLFAELMPTPALSYAVRCFGCDAGVMVTASHNAAAYNGYKVYDKTGCQVTTDVAAAIQQSINCLDPFEDVEYLAFDKALDEGLIEYIGEEFFEAYVKEELSFGLLFDECPPKDVPIVYSALNGTGFKSVMRVLADAGFTRIIPVEEQSMPDGDFPTCKYPNPESAQTMALGLEYAKRYKAELFIATDPDADRVAIAVHDENADGGYRLLTGNETAILLFDYVCMRRTKHHSMPASPVMVKTIVSTDLVESISAYYGVEVIDVLTGFKYIGEQIALLEEKKQSERFVFGFEESCGYLSGTHVRDKDAINACLLICEMFALHKANGISLIK